MLGFGEGTIIAILLRAAQCEAIGCGARRRPGYSEESDDSADNN